MTLNGTTLQRPVLVFTLGLAGVIITGLLWATVSMGTGWAQAINAQTGQNTKDIAALREEYRVINAKLDALAQMLEAHDAREIQMGPNRAK